MRFYGILNGRDPCSLNSSANVTNGQCDRKTLPLSRCQSAAETAISKVKTMIMVTTK